MRAPTFKLGRPRYEAQGCKVVTDFGVEIAVATTPGTAKLIVAALNAPQQGKRR